jgi:hypothetical protein
MRILTTRDDASEFEFSSLLIRTGDAEHFLSSLVNNIGFLGRNWNA